MIFADRLASRIEKVGSPLCVGFDPRLESIPQVFRSEARTHSDSTEEFVFRLLTSYLRTALEAVEPFAAAIKPNLAFFEMLGIGGLKAFAQIASEIRAAGIPLIADAKRGDIGSTAEAYAEAFFGKMSFEGYDFSFAEADALTVSPFLGFDTLEPFVQSCERHGTGLFVLVKTSNPGSSDLQAGRIEKRTISEALAEWINSQSERLLGTNGLSGLGAVVGATYPEEAKQLRELMPHSFFLIPGLGAQGGSAEEALAGRTKDGRGALVNVSRGILGAPSSLEISSQQLKTEVREAAEQFSKSLRGVEN